jgi:hypothetical protein
MKVRITTKKHTFDFHASTGTEAVQLFFDDVKSGKVDIHDLGLIGTWTDGINAHAFRMGPALFKCGLLSETDLEAGLKVAGIEFDSADFAAAVSADAWMVRQ